MSNKELAFATVRSVLAIIVSFYLALKLLDDIRVLWGIEIPGAARDILLLVVAWAAFAFSSKGIIKEIRERARSRKS